MANDSASSKKNKGEPGTPLEKKGGPETPFLDVLEKLVSIAGQVADIVGMPWEDHKQAQELEEKRQQLQGRLQREQLQSNRELQQELAAFNREVQLALAEQQRKNSLELAEANQIYRNWPLSVYPSQLLTPLPSSGPSPLKIIVVPPDMRFDRLEPSQAGATSMFAYLEQQMMTSVRHFLQEHYPPESPERPTRLLDGIWVSESYHGEASILALHNMLKSQPMLVLQTIDNQGDIDLAVAYWAAGGSYWYKILQPRIPFRRLLQEAAKRRALDWRALRERLKGSGYEPDMVDTMGKKISPSAEANQEVLAKNEELERRGFEALLPYQEGEQDWQEAMDVLVRVACFVLSWFADCHHLISTARPTTVSPQLFRVFPSLAACRREADDYSSVMVYW